MKKIQQGFTLIELMIVVAIIGILAAVALPAYSNYQAKSKITAGLSEIAGGKTAFQIAKNDGTVLAAGDEADVGFNSTTTQNCTIAITNTTISCTVLNAPSTVLNSVITLTYTESTSSWACSNLDSSGTQLDSQYVPASCDNATAAAAAASSDD